MNFGSKHFSISAQLSSDQKTQGGKLSDTSEIILIFIHRSQGTCQNFCFSGNTDLRSNILCHCCFFVFICQKMFDWSEDLCLHVNGEKGTKFNLTALHQHILNVTNLTLGGGSFIGNLWFSHFPISSSNRFGLDRRQRHNEHGQLLSLIWNRFR